MTNAFTIFKSRLATWREWEPNPVLLKELRQAMRSHVLTGMLMLLLAALFGVSLVFFARENLTMEASRPMGLPVLSCFLAILTLVTFMFIPLYVGIRLAVERQETNFDLMFITTLGPSRIVRGKLLCGVYLAAMFFSMCMPFMAFTNLLRGVDLPTIFFILICLFSVVCLAIQAAIFIGCLRVPLPLKIFIGLLFTFGLAVGCAVQIMFFINLIKSGVAAVVSGPSSWVGAAMLLLLILGGMGLLYLMSVSLLAADNRPRGMFNEVLKEGVQ